MDARKTVLVVLTIIEVIAEILYWFVPFKNENSERNCFRISGIISIIWLVFCMYFFFKILYLIFDYPHKHYTFKHFEI